MLKKIRKHNRWLMAGFGVLLMVTWLVQPAMNQIGAATQNRTYGKLDGQRVSYAHYQTAGRELSAITALLPGIVENYFGIRERDPDHWLILTREAENAGLVGGAADGEAWGDTISFIIAQGEIYRQFGQFAQQVLNNPQMNQQFFQPMYENIRKNLPNLLDRVASNSNLRRDEMYKAIARARGVYRLVEAYQNAARLSDRATVVNAREILESAKIDYLFVPAERMIDTLPAPDPAALQAHFEKFKNTKPGEGEFGIGYMLPSRVKLEWLKLDRAAIENVVPLDAVEVRKRYNQFKGTGEGKKYPKEFAEERANVERDMKGEVADRIMQDAQVAIQTEIGKATKNLESDGKYRKLPADWSERRPKFDQVASAIVEAVKKSTGITIPLPEVTSKGAEWLTRQDLQFLPGIGRSQIKQGGLPPIDIADVVFWTRELPRAATDPEPPIAVQVNLPLVESYFTDGADRFYVCVLDTKAESALDSLEEKKDQIVKDFKKVQVFETLKGRVDEFKTKAIAGGLDALIPLFPAMEAPKPEKPDSPPPTDAKYRPLAVNKDVLVFKDSMSDRSPFLSDESVYKEVLSTAAKLDPLMPRDKVPAESATIAMPIPKSLGVGVIRVLNPEPVTKEKLRALDLNLAREIQNKEFEDVKAGEQFPFSVASLLKRHKYITGEREIRTAKDLRKDEKDKR